MNYRHAYHAGNFADVLKHAVLALAIEYQKAKLAPFRIIDTHAGPGRYDLKSAEAGKTNEWRDGIGRLLGPDADPIPDGPAETLAPYLDIVRRFNQPYLLRTYPGSPLIARSLIRPGDKLIVNELHPADRNILAAQFERDKQTTVLGLDGWVALKSLLPPPERRGVILIDPPFEQPGELDRLARGLTAAIKRFATGVYILWYPIKDRRPVEAMYDGLRALDLDKLIRVEVTINADTSGYVLSGCGLVILNPPFTLEAQLNEVLPMLAARMKHDAGTYIVDHL